jgi:hypothetical protein
VLAQRTSVREAHIPRHRGCLRLCARLWWYRGICVVFDGVIQQDRKRVFRVEQSDRPIQSSAGSNIFDKVELSMH